MHSAASACPAAECLHQVQGVRSTPAGPAAAQGRKLVSRIKPRDVNRMLTYSIDDIFGWSMRPWESVPAIPGTARGLPGSHGPVIEHRLRANSLRRGEPDPTGPAKIRPAVAVGEPSRDHALVTGEIRACRHTPDQVRGWEAQRRIRSGRAHVHRACPGVTGATSDQVWASMRAADQGRNAESVGT
jgi:hypothetical protein